jgi:hypothetical protein
MKTKAGFKRGSEKPAAIENENQNKKMASEPSGCRLQEWKWVSRGPRIKSWVRP